MQKQLKLLFTEAQIEAIVTGNDTSRFDGFRQDLQSIKTGEVLNIPYPTFVEDGETYEVLTMFVSVQALIGKDFWAYGGGYAVNLNEFLWEVEHGGANLGGIRPPERPLFPAQD